MASHDDHITAPLDRGGWRLGDARARHREHPDTFLLPDAAELDAVGPGSLVRLLFVVVDQADGGRDGMAPYDADGLPALVTIIERMWAYVERCDGDECAGWLESLPTASHTALEPGCRLRFRRSDIIDTRPASPDAMREAARELAEAGWPQRDEEVAFQPVDRRRIRRTSDEQRAVCEEAGVRPEPPYFMTGATVSTELHEGGWPVYGLRSSPSQEHNQCGWFVWTGDPDFSRHEWDLIPAGSVRERRPEAEQFLALPPGWGFVLGPDGGRDVWYDEVYLEGSGD